MKGIFRSYVSLVLLCDVGVFSAWASASASILSFSFEVKDSATGRWKSSNSITKGTYTRLNCITLSDSPSSTVQIRKEGDSEPLQPVMYSGGQVFYEFGNITCDRMGTYVCDGGDGSRRNLDLGILQCQPQPCKGDPRNQSLFVKENESKSFSLCLMAYPNISGLELEKNGQLVGGTTWRSEPQAFAAYRVHVELPNTLGLGYGVHKLDVFCYGAQMERKMLDYSVELKYFGVPDCPTIDQIKTGSLHNVTLTWQPGFGKGGKQRFYVYSSTSSWSWRSEGDTYDNLQIIKGLAQGVTYTFRVVSAHEYMQNINADLCENDIDYTPGDEKFPSPGKTTFPTSASTTKDKDSFFPSTEVWVAIVVVLLNIIVIVVIIAIVIHIRKGRLLRAEKERKGIYYPESRASHTTENTDSLMSESERSDYYNIEGRREHLYEVVD